MFCNFSAYEKFKSQATDFACAKALRQDKAQPVWVGEQKPKDKVAQDERIRWGFSHGATEDNNLPTHSTGFHPASLQAFLLRARTGLLSWPPSPPVPAPARALFYPEHDKLIVPLLLKAASPKRHF